MFIVCHFFSHQGPSSVSQLGSLRYCLLHLVLGVLQAGPGWCGSRSDGLTQVESAPSGPLHSAGKAWMVQQLKVHMVSGVAPGRAYCSMPGCGPRGRNDCWEARIWVKWPPLCPNQRAEGVLGFHDELHFQYRLETKTPSWTANVMPRQHPERVLKMSYSLPGLCPAKSGKGSEMV